MGIGNNWHGWYLFENALEAVGKPFKELRMAELGDQVVREPPPVDIFAGVDTKRKIWKSAKTTFENVGVFHISFDVNGKRGALPQDLRKPLTYGRRYKGSFDLVTNFGTSEHIYHDGVRAKETTAQKQVFRNIHDLCSVGGVMLHNVPHWKNEKRHGFWVYGEEFFSKLAEVNGYEILLNEHRSTLDDENQFACLVLLRKKDDKPFRTQGVDFYYQDKRGRVHKGI